MSLRTVTSWSKEEFVSAVKAVYDEQETLSETSLKTTMTLSLSLMKSCSLVFIPFDVALVFDILGIPGVEMFTRSQDY